MKKLLISLLGVSLLSFGALYVAAESDPVVDKANGVGVAIAELLAQKDQAYVQDFYIFLDGLIVRFTEAQDVTRLKIINTIKDVLIHKVPYTPSDALDEVKVCYDTSKAMLLCNDEYAPVCGVDMYTYGNRCNLEAAEVELLYEGECKTEDKPQICTMEYAPVCWTDGKTYGNLCGLQASDAGFLFVGSCEDNTEKLSCVPNLYS